MFLFRPFRNTDVPGLVQIWRNQPPMDGRLQELSVQQFEQYVLAKPYFDRYGLIVATQSDQLAGFIHAGFGPTAGEEGLDPHTGVIAALLTSPETSARQTLEKELLEQARQYLRNHGAVVAFGGGVLPMSPFYCGTYGGCQLVGVLPDDQQQRAAYQGNGFAVHATYQIWQRDLSGYRVPFNRDRMTFRREYQIEVDHYPRPRSWFRACQLAFAQQVRVRLVSKRTGAEVGSAHFWDLQPLAQNWPAPAAGAVHFEIDPARRHDGLGGYLLSESLRQLEADNVGIVQIAAPTDNVAASALLKSAQFSRHLLLTTFRQNL